MATASRRRAASQVSGPAPVNRSRPARLDRATSSVNNPTSRCPCCEAVKYTYGTRALAQNSSISRDLPTRRRPLTSMQRPGASPARVARTRSSPRVSDRISRSRGRDRHPAVVAHADRDSRTIPAIEMAPTLRSTSRISPTDALAAGAGLLLPTVFSPSVAAPFFSPKAAVLLVTTLAAAPLLVGAWQRSRPATMAAAAFLTAGLLSAVLSQRPVLALTGLYNLGTGWFFMLGLVVLWSLGLHLGDRGRALFTTCLVTAIVVNATVAVLQVTFDLSAVNLPRFDGRASGLVGNPVHLSALLAGGVPLLGPVFRRRPLLVGPAVVLVGAAVSAAGGRAGLLLAVVGLVATATTALSARPRHTAAFVTLFSLGLIMGVALGRTSGTATATVDERLQVGVSGGDLAARLDAWEQSTKSIGRHPLVGVGPGQFRAATVADRTFETGRLIPDNYFLDAHNLVVEYATTTGVLGVAALLAWFALLVRRASGPLLFFGLLVLASHLIQPQALSTTPLAFLALGAASASPLALSPLGPSPMQWRRLTAGLVAVGMAAAGVLLLGDYRLRLAQRDFSLDHGRAALRALPPWPQTATTLGRIYTFGAHPDRNPVASAAARRWLLAAAERDPRSPALWNDLADLEYVSRLSTEARMHYRLALTLDPWSVRALNGLGEVALAAGDDAQAARYFRDVQRIVPDHPNARARLRELGGF